jgi:hypothetical protein
METTGRMYVPDTKKWTNFYTQISKGNVNPYTDHSMKGYQRGGGLRNNTSPFMVSIDKYAKELNEREIRPAIKMTSPSEQVVEQAKSEVVRKKTKKRKSQLKHLSEKQTLREDERPIKKKIVKLNSDVFGLY